ncbi:MAG: hypothetical protein ACTSUE_04925 [Promethearchaeota archaeon]
MHEHPARIVANEVLKGINEDNYELLTQHFSPANKKKFMTPGGDLRAEKLASVVKEMQRSTSGVNCVSQLRKGPSWLGEGSIIAKVKEVEGRVFSISLKREGEIYYFDDVISPSVKRFAEAELIEE